MSHEQLTFTLPVREARGREDFFVSPANAEAMAAIETWPKWPNGKLMLVGPMGSGKTHLGHVWARISGAAIVSAAELTEDGVPPMAEAGAVVVEDADRELRDERALFHLHNLLAQSGGALLLTARVPPRDWHTGLPDLRSRMAATSVARLSSPDDDLLRAVILKQFNDRQLTVSPALIEWLLARIDRSFASAKNAVEALDKIALKTGKPITRALARSHLDKLGMQDA